MSITLTIVVHTSDLYILVTEIPSNHTYRQAIDIQARGGNIDKRNFLNVLKPLKSSHPADNADSVRELFRVLSIDSGIVYPSTRGD